MFVKTNNEISYTATDIEAMKEIPKGNWLLKFDPNRGYYLELTPDFKFPKKIYGDAEKLAKRYLNTFDNTEGNVGILLTGTKGTGKSITAKLTASKSKLAVIIITEPFHDEDFKSLLSNISQKCIVFVDEFEKTYFNQELQNSFLSILDGVFEGKKLFLFTSNEKERINPYMLNRPGRIHYLGEYDSLSDEIIEDVIKDTLENKDHKEGLVEILNILGTVTMDILISLIKEMNMYKESAKEAVKYLNLKPESSSYEVDVFQGSVRLGDASFGGHPLSNEEFSLEFFCENVSVYNAPECARVDSFDDEPEAPVAMNQASIQKVERASEWLYFSINIPESKVTHSGKKIIIETDNDMRFVFSKKESYQYAF